MKRTTGLVVFFAFIMISVANAKQNPSSESKAESVSAVTLKGVILDKQTKESLAGATIMANGKKIYSDLDGNFELKDMNINRDEKCTLTISLISYKDITVNVDLNANKNLQISLVQQ